jgi:predicted aspartyl protease
MRHLHLGLIAFALLATGSDLFKCRLAGAQDQTGAKPVVRTLKAKSKSITIIDGDDRLVGQIVPELDVDTYVYHPSGNPKTISFITDVDQFDFHVAPGEVIDFSIELEEPLQEKRICPQRLSPIDPQGVKYRGPTKSADGGGVSGDVIAFTLGPNHAIHFQGSINGSGPLDLIFDTGASIGVLSEQGRAKGASVTEGKSNRFSFAEIEVENVPISFIDYGGSLKADGVVGYNCFMGKMVKIDYTEKQMVIFDALPEMDSGYQKLDLLWRGAGTFVEITLPLEGREYQTLALFDTGSKWSLSLCMSDPFVRRNFEQLSGEGTRWGRMASGTRVKNKVVTLEELRLGDTSMKQVQADLEYANREGGLAFNILGNDFLRRFDAVIDYQKSEIYLKPNGLVAEPYNQVLDMGRIYWTGAAVAAGLVGILGLFRWRRKLKSRVA